jgi:hypothetical protein
VRPSERILQESTKNDVSRSQNFCRLEGSGPQSLYSSRLVTTRVIYFVWLQAIINIRCRCMILSLEDFFQAENLKNFNFSVTSNLRLVFPRYPLNPFASLNLKKIGTVLNWLRLVYAGMAKSNKLFGKNSRLI